MSHNSGKQVFTEPRGVQYLIDRYLSPSDREELRRLNTDITRDRFQEKLIKKLEQGSGSRGWIPRNYTDELVTNAGAVLGTSRVRRRLKNKKEVDVYTTPRGNNVYEDRKGKIRDFSTGKYTSKKTFDD